jgi:hypothetical protein
MRGQVSLWDRAERRGGPLTLQRVYIEIVGRLMPRTTVTFPARVRSRKKGGGGDDDKRVHVALGDG